MGFILFPADEDFVPASNLHVESIAWGFRDPSVFSHPFLDALTSFSVTLSLSWALYRVWTCKVTRYQTLPIFRDYCVLRLLPLWHGAFLFTLGEDKLQIGNRRTLHVLLCFPDIVGTLNANFSCCGSSLFDDPQCSILLKVEIQ